MKLPQSLLLLGCIPFLLPACGGDHAPSYADAPSALDAGARAVAADDPIKAAEAYTYAEEHAPGPELRYQALLGLAKTLAPTDPEGAAAAFARIDQECADQWEIRGARAQIDTWIRAGNAENAKAALAAAAARFPDQKDKFATQEKGIAALESGSSTDLHSLGYVGD